MRLQAHRERDALMLLPLSYGSGRTRSGGGGGGRDGDGVRDGGDGGNDGGEWHTSILRELDVPRARIAHRERVPSATRIQARPRANVNGGNASH